jgi:hypothetical protein
MGNWCSEGMDMVIRGEEFEEGLGAKVLDRVREIRCKR